MYSPQEQQIEVLLLKSSLQDIEDELIVQMNALPSLDAEAERQYRETLAALRDARAVNHEVERLKQDNVRLLAKRMQLRSECEEMSRAIASEREKHSAITTQIKQENQEQEGFICKYEDDLKGIADRFRKARMFYSEEEINNEIEKTEAANRELANEVERNEIAVERARAELAGLSTNVPDDIMNILGRPEVERKVQEAIALRSELEETMKNLQKN